MTRFGRRWQFRLHQCLVSHLFIRSALCTAPPFLPPPLLHPRVTSFTILSHFFSIASTGNGYTGLWPSTATLSESGLMLNCFCLLQILWHPAVVAGLQWWCGSFSFRATAAHPFEQQPSPHQKKMGCCVIVDLLLCLKKAQKILLATGY